MSKKILIDGVYPSETRVVLLDRNNDIEQFEYQTSFKDQIKGNIYLAKITRIEPSLQAAFIDYGEEKNGFLPFSEIHPSYYNIPNSDKSGEEAKELNIKAITPPDIDSVNLNSENKIDYQEAEEQNSGSDDDEIPNELKDEDYQKSKYIDLDVDEEDLETVDKNSRSNHYEEKDYRIQEVLKKGQLVLVQAQKEERGNKGASFTSFITLAGRYCVLMPNKPNQSGISKRISKISERRKLRSIVSSLSEGNEVSSIIIRTAGIGRSFEEIKRDYDYLIKLWNQIREVTLKSNAPNFIHVEEDLIQKAVRDLYDNHTNEILIQGDQAYQNVISYMDNLMLESDEKKVKLYDNKTPLFTKFGIEEQISQLYQPIVNLPSGGYVVINPTEALIAIDVNSGRATSERCIEETALKTNLEAAKEIARQLRLRDLSGLLVLDFIDMYEVKNRKIIERCFRDYLSHDKARIQVGYISSFGLLQMSRQRLRPSFLESNTSICHQCNGKGLVRADESNAMVILRTIENEIYRGSYKAINVFAALNAILYITNHKRDIINYIEERYNAEINFYQDPKATADSFSIEKIRKAKKSEAGSEDANARPLIKPGEIMAESVKENPFAEKRVAEENSNATTSSSVLPKRKKWRNNKADNSAKNREEAESVANEEAQKEDLDIVKTHEPDNFSSKNTSSSNKKSIKASSSNSKSKNVKAKSSEKNNVENNTDYYSSSADYEKGQTNSKKTKQAESSKNSATNNNEVYGSSNKTEGSDSIEAEAYEGSDKSFSEATNNNPATDKAAANTSSRGKGKSGRGNSEKSNSSKNSQQLSRSNSEHGSDNAKVSRDTGEKITGSAVNSVDSHDKTHSQETGENSSYPAQSSNNKKSKVNNKYNSSSDSKEKSKKPQSASSETGLGNISESSKQATKEADSNEGKGNIIASYGPSEDSAFADRWRNTNPANDTENSSKKTSEISKAQEAKNAPGSNSNSPNTQDIESKTSYDEELANSEETSQDSSSTAKDKSRGKNRSGRGHRGGKRRNHRANSKRGQNNTKKPETAGAST